MKIKSYVQLIKIGFLGITVSSLLFIISNVVMISNFDDIFPFLLYPSIFLLIATLIIRIVLLRIKKQVFKYIGNLIIFPITLILAGFLMGLLITVLNLSFENLHFYTIYWSAWGISFGWYFGIPIYVVVVYLQYRGGIGHEHSTRRPRSRWRGKRSHDI